MPQSDQAARADRQRDGAEPEQRRRRHGSAGSLGIWVNGEMAIIPVGHCSGRPNTVMTPTSATAVHASAMDFQGSSPNSKTATATTTIVAGSRANAASSNLGIWVLTDPVRTP